LDLPLGLLWCKLAWYIFLAFLTSSTRYRCPIHPRLWSSIKVLMFTSLCNLKAHIHI
jgi:hypothetical protein